MVILGPDIEELCKVYPKMSIPIFIVASGSVWAFERWLPSDFSKRVYVFIRLGSAGPFPIP